jgi:ribosome maturation factor RimP
MFGRGARLVFGASCLAYRLVTESPVDPTGGRVRTIQDEELAVASLPSREQVIELLEGEFTKAGYEIEDVLIGPGRPPRITVVADSEDGLNLDAVATLSRVASASMDAIDDELEPYVLEVTSRGVDRPLTSEKHFRRARGRKVEVSMADGSSVTARLGQTAGGVVHLVVSAGKEFTISPVPIDDIVKAIVQVEFSTPNGRELELSQSTGEGDEA